MLSVFDLFKIGIGPSSSHTVGPMLAAKNFAALLAQQQANIARIKIELYGSLALTGEGHGTVGGILLGLEGYTPKNIDPVFLRERVAQLRAGAPLLLNQQAVPLQFARDIVLHKHLFLPLHANGLRFTAFDAEQRPLQSETYYSVGGGFVVTEAQFGTAAAEPRVAVPYPFKNSQELMAQCQSQSIAELMLTNESCWQSEADVRAQLLEIAEVMRCCIETGCAHEGRLPGSLAIKRRAPELSRRLAALQLEGRSDIMLWPMLYAIAVSEENASGGRVVTAPTNGAAGIIPAVLQYYRNFAPDACDDKIVEFLLTAAAIGMLYKMNASISGAEVGCQGEVGVACSMAAGAYCAVLGGTLAQIENAAEIAMEHHLGLTCDPVGGQVQIPCVERNGVAAEKAIKVAQLALLGDGEHVISLDKVIETMYRTGLDMKHIYKETSLGGLALTVAVPEC